MQFATAMLRFSCLGLILCTACGLGPDRSGDLDPNADNRDKLCRPTGRALVDTGVYIGPGACDEVILHPSEDGRYSILSVGFPLYGQQNIGLRVTNDTTGDSETEEAFAADPEFVLYHGDYSLGGLAVRSGDNDLRYVLYKFDDPSERPIDSGSFQLRVRLAR